ncbi:MAG: aminomethyltransferase family protein [Syntrophobacteraceae bacterium]
MGKRLRRTLLHGRHMAYGANMADFGGYEMPLWYPSGVKREHLAVLTKAGIFDTSHMAAIEVGGPGAFDLLQFCFTRDLRACVGKDRSPLTPGKCVYGAFLNSHGEVLDDAIAYHLEQDGYLVVVNCAMGGAIARHLARHRRDEGVEIKDLTDGLGKMDIQGPLSAKILQVILADPDKVFQNLSYFSFKGSFDAASPQVDHVRLKDGTPILLSRSGYTGEFGFEIFISPDLFVHLWDTVLEAGREFGAIPCGLAARDSLRAGAVLPLSHQDIGPWPFVNHPWTFALPFNDDLTAFTKEFIGAKALLNVRNPEFTYAFVGNDLRKVGMEERALVLDSQGNEIGSVLTCVSEMGIGRHEGRIYSVASPDKPEGFDPKGLSCGFIKVRTEPALGDIVELKDRRRTITVTIVDDIRPDRTARRSIREMA